MEEYLRRVHGRLGADESEGPVHAVLGGPRPDVDTVAATLCLALHLSQKEPSGGLCLPVLCGRRGSAALPEDTVKYLQRVNICESLLLWREDVDLATLHYTGKLSLTLLRDGLLDSSEYPALESSVVRVVHHDRQQDTGDDGALFAVTTVAREIRQEAPEHIRAALGKTIGEALRLQNETLRLKHGRPSTQLEELRRTLEPPSDVGTNQSDLEELLTTGLKEFSDGEMTLALSSLTTDQEQWPSYVGGLKSFSQRHGLDCLLVRLSCSDTVHHPSQQVAVYSNDTDILNQICCELEDSFSWSLSRELEAQENLQVYHVPINTSLVSGTPPLLEVEIQSFLKDFADRRSSVLACHPSSRTSSTEGVAGSVEFSQGSSGINDMDASDTERAEGGSADAVAIGRVMTDGDEDTGGVGVSAGGELVSPDSGLTTIRSSRSSKESSVFLSDDSPVGEVIAGGGPAGLLLRNPSPLGLTCLSPPVPLERRKHRTGRNKTDNFDLFSFDPLQSNDASSSAGGELSHSEVRGNGGLKGIAESSNLSELEELSFLDFSSDSRNSSIDHRGQNQGNEIMDTVVPPTPVNSLAGSCPPNSCVIRFFPEDVAERINGLQQKYSMSSSLSETWDELCIDTQGVLSSSDNIALDRTKEYESPQNIVEDNGFKESMTERESREEMLKNAHQRPKSLQPQLSLVIGQTESDENWNTDSVLREPWNPATLADLQLTPPEEEGTGKWKAGIIGAREKTVSRKKAAFNMLTPDTSKEEDEGVQGKTDNKKMELLDFWTYSAQKGFLKSDSGTTTSYPESLDMWNMTIRDDSLSPLTTPDNLSENSGSFCGGNPSVVGGTSVESPPEFCNGGMEMWNTTIQEDSSSTVTSPEGPDNGKEPSHMGSPEASDSPETCAGKESEEEKAAVVENDVKKVISHSPEEVEWGVNEHNVRIVIEAAESRAQGEDSGEEEMQNYASEYSEKETSPPPDTNMWDLPVPGMVNSTSEYDNVGAGQWSQTSSPETYASPLVDMIELDGQSSPFIAVTKPVQLDETQDQSYQASTEGRAAISVKEHPVSQVFLFEGTSGGSSLESEYDNKGKEGSIEADWVEKPGDSSPFVLVDYSAATYHLNQGEAADTQILTDQSLSSSHVNWDSSVSASFSNALSIAEDRTASEIQRGDNKENGEVEHKSISSSSSGKRDTLKCSPDSLHSGSRDEARSNSDGDSSSGLEMECIVVSGTVKEAERQWHDRPKQGNKQTKGTKKFMETFSTLFHAATVLQTQVQGAHTEHQETMEQNGQNQNSSDMEQNQAVLPTYRDLDNTTHPMVSEMFSPSQSKVISEASHQSQSRPKGYSQTQVEDDKSSTVARSVSPSLRYPSDNFLKAREEVYVHSQISMEDSDEGGHSPSAPPLSPASLGNFQNWGGQLVRQDTPQAPSEIESPVLTNSSVSHTSSFAGTPFSESGISTDRGIGLPFSGDLMEEENDEEGQEEETDMEQTTLTKLTPDQQNEGGKKNLSGSCDLLSFNEELSRGSTLEMEQGRFLQDMGGCYIGQPGRTVEHDGGLSDQQTGSHEASQDGYSLVSRTHQGVTSLLPSQPTNENAAYQWTGSHDVTQGQTQYGYNYHHIDQRTEIQNTHSNCAGTKSDSQCDTTAAYAEFTPDPAATTCGSDQTESCYEAGVNAEYTLEHNEFQYMAENQHGGDSSLQCSRYQTDGQRQYEMDRAQYQLEGQPFYQSDVQPEREDHAQYVPEGYVLSALSSRHSQQRDGAAGMMMKLASSEEAAEGLDNDEDPASSADVSGSSNQRRKLAAPPMSVSLDHSEGSLLSEDALDTEDEALDTGDDLDIDIDELDTPDEADSPEPTRHGDPDSYLGAEAPSSDVPTGHSSAGGSRDSRLWRSVVIGEQEHRIDMKSIEPYKRVISHGGYYAQQNAIIVFAACFLPDSDCDNYSYVMENLFLYVISTLELMVADDYMIVYLNGATPRRRMPGFSWMKKCYQMIDRRLKKNLKMFIIVHPSWFIRTLLGITRPFISSKFSSKIKYVSSLRELGEIIPMEYVHIPPSIVKYDGERGKHRFACTRLDTDLQEITTKADKKGYSAV